MGIDPHKFDVHAQHSIMTHAEYIHVPYHKEDEKYVPLQRRVEVGPFVKIVSDRPN